MFANLAPRHRRARTPDRCPTSTRRWGICALFLYLAIFLFPLGARPVAIADEARYAEIPREMIASGDWVVPHLDGLRYFEKPPLGYWLTAFSMRAFGETPFGVRFSSAAATGMTALLIYWLVRRETGHVPLAMCSCVTYLTSLLVVLVGTISLLDMIFTMFVTASIIFFLAAHREEAGAVRRICLVILFGVSCAMAFLTKGFIAFAVPVVVIVPFVLWERQAKGLLGFAVWPIVIAALTIVPWALLIHRRESDFWRYFFWEEHIRRYLSNQAQHRKPDWFFVPILLLGALPWTPVLPAAGLGLRRARDHRSFVRFLVCWLVFPFLFFSGSRGKLATYVLPCFPSLAVLTTMGLLSALREGRHRLFDVGAGFLAAVAGSGALILSVSEVVPGIPLKPYPPREPPWILPAVGMAACSVMWAESMRAKTPFRKFVMFAMAPVLLFAATPFAVPDAIVAARSADPFLSRHRGEVPASSILVSDADRVSAVCWSFKRNDVSVLASRGELDYGLAYEDAAARYLRLPDLATLIQDSRGRRPVTVVTSSARYEQYRHALPDPVVLEIDSKVGDGRALVIARY